MTILFKKIFKSFQSQGTLESATPYGSGHINDTYWVKTQEQNLPDYILQRINHKIFKNVPMLMDNILRVTEHVRHKLLQIPGSNPDRETLTVIKTLENLPYHLDEEGNYWRMYIFIADTDSYDKIDSPEKAYQGGVAFGAFQHYLSDLPGGPLFETIPNFHNIKMRLAKLHQAADQDVKQRKSRVQSELDFIASLSDEMQTILRLGESGQIPLRVTHNDTKFNNVLLDHQTGKGLCVIDLDTVMPGYLQYDFSDTIRTATNTGAEDDTNLSQVSMSLPVFEGFAKGFLSQVKDTLTPAELAHLVPCASLLPYTIGVRFLTDYLEGDVYFKIHSPEHNYQRTRAQLQLVKSIRSQRQAMQAVVDRIMG